MSLISRLGQRIENLPEIIEEYEQHLSDADAHVSITGKTYAYASKEQVAWQHHVLARRAELKPVVDFLETRYERIKAAAFREFTENYNRDLSDRAKDRYILGEKKVISAYEIFLTARELLDKYDATITSYTSRGYILTNMSRVLAAGQEEYLFE